MMDFARVLSHAADLEVASTIILDDAFKLKMRLEGMMVDEEVRPSKERRR